MGLSNAQRQRRWRAKRAARLRGHPDVVEGELLVAAGRCERLSEEERIALADQLADVAMVHLRRAQELAAVARRVRGVELLGPQAAKRAKAAGS
jgi:hypothetical protein